MIEKLGGRIGRYTLLDVLGEGGMGVVYLAEQTEPVQRQVALKVIKPGMDSMRVIARFEAEQQALALMDHAHVARVFDAGLAPSGRPYFVMEHVKGIPITKYCDRNKQSIDERLGLFVHVCEAVQHAHQKGIIHRDIKPSNILVAVEDAEALPKVIDFGVARAVAQTLTERTLYTQQDQLVGTPEYMSPEQADANNQDIDTRTDVYSLGVVLYELLTGMLPYDPEILRKGGVEHMRMVICAEDPKTPSTRLSKTSAGESRQSARHRGTDVRTLRHKLRGDLDWITLKALEKDPTRRYMTVDALATDIRRYVDHEPVSAAPPDICYRMKKFARRHRQPLVLTALLIAATFAIGLSLFLYQQANIERRRAESFQHARLLSEAQQLHSERKRVEALATVAPLLDSAYVGRQATLLHAQLMLDDPNLAAAVGELESLLDEDDDIAGQAHFHLANIYYNGDPCAPGGTQEYYQRWQQHREQAEQLIADTASYYFLRAKAAYSVKEMLDMLGKALELDKQHYDSLRERAQIYYSQHDYDKMARDAARMIGIRPDNPHGYALSALAMREQGRFDEALQDHNEAIQLAPEDAHLYDTRRETYARLDQYEPALRDAIKCAELLPRDLPYRQKLFATYTALGRYDKAQHEYAHFMSCPILQEHHPGNPTQNLRDIFHLYSIEFVTEALAAGRYWHGLVEPPRTAPYCLMYHIDPCYRELCARGKRLIPKGFHPSWSPDGTELAYSHGLLLASGVAVLSMDTGRVELLTTSGRNPQWSPDGHTIAFERNRRIWPADRLAGLNIRTLRPGGLLPTHASEVWIADRVTHEIRRVCEGTSPHWGHHSGRLYYISPQHSTLYSLSLTHRDARPVRILSDCSRSAVISPDERHVADQSFRELRIINVASGNVVATWMAPPRPLGDLKVSWSPDSRELSISGGYGNLGLWIYDMETGDASKVLDGWWMTSCWSPDRSRLALTLLPPEIWLVELKHGRSTATSFDSAQTIEEHCLNFMEGVNQTIAMDPAYMRIHYVRAECALWMGHEEAHEYLRQFEQVLPPYNAANCAHEARWILDAAPELRDRLLPLALLLARKAVEKEPENAEFLTILAQAQKWQDELSAQKRSSQ